MGTNYYWLRPNEAYEEHEISRLVQPKYEMVHIGRSSAGWCFKLHVYPNGYNGLDINSWAQWKRLFKDLGDDLILVNEYYEKIDLDYLKTVVEDRSSSQDWETFDKELREGKYKFYRDIKNLDEFLRRNSAIKGPNNLMRSKIDNRHCIGHADGPWDYMVGEFS